MRIAVISNVYPPLWSGGCELLCKNVVEHLRMRGHQISILTSNHGNVGKEERYLYPILEPSSPYGKPPLCSFVRKAKVASINYRRSLEFLKEVKPDVVFAWHMGRISLGPIYAVQDFGIPILFSINDGYILQYRPACLYSNGWKGFVKGLLENVVKGMTYKNVKFNHLIVISQKTKDSLVAAGVPIHRAKVIYQGIPLERFQYVSRSCHLGKVVKLLYVGSLIPEKGVLTVIEAIPFLKKECEGVPFVLDIVGDGPQRDSLVHYCRRTGLSNFVNFLGKVEPDSIQSFYRGHDIFIFPSIWEEPFGLTFLEAMACGTPVVSTATGGNREFLRDGENCLIFNAGDPEELAGKIVELVTDVSLYERLSRNAVKDVRERFSLDRYVDRIEKILQGLASPRKG